jgi:hypothetical protein
MLRLLIDQDLDHVILRGLLLRIPSLDFLTAHQAGLGEAPDSDLLVWAAEKKRMLITHDRRTMLYHAAQLIERGEQSSGVLIVSRQLPVSQVIDD